MKYTIFRTKWGYFGLVATDNGLLRTCLPLVRREKVKSQLLQNFPDSQYENGLFRKVQQQITAYFEGDYVNFRDIPIVLNGFSSFASLVLIACRDIEFGRTVNYGRLAEMASKPRAARAVGNALARNPLPLIIPCHRVIRADGSLGGFSAMGGVKLKKRMLELEAGFV